MFADGGPVRWPAKGGLMGSRELQGGRMLIIKRPHVAKFMFIWAARRKSFPEDENQMDQNCILKGNLKDIIITNV